MTPEEYATWADGNDKLWGVSRAESPCRDCTPLFHQDMLDGGMCDGEPLAGERAPAKPGRKFNSETERRRYWTEHRRASRERARASA
jgi:hypothetical protein